jgi:hypothetical protein
LFEAAAARRRDDGEFSPRPPTAGSELHYRLDGALARTDASDESIDDLRKKAAA